MKLGYFLRDIIVEASRMEVLIDKYTKSEGKKKLPKMDLSILAEIIFADPTTKKPQDFDQTNLNIENLLQVQPGAYSNWLIKHYVQPSLGSDFQSPDIDPKLIERQVKEARRIFLEDLSKTTENLREFTKNKQYFPVENRDINKFTPQSLFDFLENFQLPENVKKKKEKTELKKEIRKERKGFSHPGSTVEFVGNDWTVVKISDTGKMGGEAASWFGGFQDYKNGESNWCTSPPESRNFDYYIKNGPLYVILSNDERGPVGSRTGLPQERYQFHFPSNQFMDRADRQIDLVNFLNGKAAELKEYFKPEFAKGMATKDSTKVEVEYPGSSVSKFIALYGFEQFFDNLPKTITTLLFNNKSNENISLDIPSSIGEFTELTGLFLMNCVKSLPKEVGNLKNLSFLALPNNPNLKTIPDEVLTIPELMFVNLKGSKPNLSEKFLETFSEEGGGFYTRAI